MKIEIWSDVSCPFCFIGKRHLESALQSYSNKDQVEIVWKSFQLDPTLPENSDQNVYEMLAEKKGLSASQVKQMTYHVEQMGKEAGLHYDFSKPKPVSTYKAQLLLQLAKQNGLGEVAKERLLDAYFMKGMNVSDTAVLKKIGMEIGLTEEQLSGFNERSDLQSKLENDLYEARTMGISGVPFFVFNNQFAISGAQPVQVFINALQKASAMEIQKEIAEKEAPACAPEADCK